MRLTLRNIFIAPAFLIVISLCGSRLHAQAAGQSPNVPSILAAPGSLRRYCNPLAIESSAQNGSAAGISLGDVTVIRENGKYYMYCSGGAAWVSDNLLDWQYHRVEGRVPGAPDVVKYNGYFYMTGNDAPLYRSKDPLGPYELVGDWKVQGQGWDGAFDMKIFVDDDNKPYLYFPGRSVHGIYGVPLDPNDLTRFAAPPTHLFAFDSSHTWERWGEMNEYSQIAWIEGPWMFKHNGTYYLEYSGSGTQWVSYATGVYTSKSPLGPFTYAPKNPLIRKTDGVVTGAGHGCAVEDTQGNWWQLYTIVDHNPPGGRRIGMDAIGFDADGNMFVRGPTETPQFAPGVVPDAARNGDSGSIPVTINKFADRHETSTFSSQRPGHEAAYAIDNSNGTWWEPAEGDNQPTLMIDLVGPTQYDPDQSFVIDSCRILFNTGASGFGRGGGIGGRGAAPTTVPQGAARGPSASAGPGLAATQPTGPVAHQYKIEASMDGKTFTTVLDKTANNVTKYTEFEEIPPTQCKFVRLTITGWPHVANSPLGITEFTVFGKAVESAKR